MATHEQVVQWAREQADLVQSDMRFLPSEGGYGGFWTMEDGQLKGRMMARVASALEFIRQYAGAESEWMARARIAWESQADRASLESGAQAIGEILRVWAEQIEQGSVQLPADTGQGLRSVASSDIMEQVRTLNSDKAVHPAASIVLAGAALETALRGAVEQLELDVRERPGIAAYGRALRTANVITKQDMKDVDQMAGLRNDAAHGDFDRLSPERAGLMEQQVNLFLAHLSERMADANPSNGVG
ncbi:hypothetical protein ACWEOW_23330 [Monashia sp. NPDC004114]